MKTTYLQDANRDLGANILEFECVTQAWLPMSQGIDHYKQNMYYKGAGFLYNIIVKLFKTYAIQKKICKIQCR